MVTSFALQDLGLLSRAARWAWRMVAMETLASLAEGLLCAFVVGVLQSLRVKNNSCVCIPVNMEVRGYSRDRSLWSYTFHLLQKMLCFPSLCFKNPDRLFQGVIVCCASVRKELLSDSRSDHEDLHCEVFMTSCHGGRIHRASAAGKVHPWPVLQAAFELWSAPLSVMSHVPQCATPGTRPTGFYQHISWYSRRAAARSARTDMIYASAAVTTRTRTRTRTRTTTTTTTTRTTTTTTRTRTTTTTTTTTTKTWKQRQTMPFFFTRC